MRVMHVERLNEAQPIIERVVRGPEPPLGIGFPRRSIRCQLGLHLWRKVWAFTRVEETHDGYHHSVMFQINLDRPHDYIECARCGEMRG